MKQSDLIKAMLRMKTREELEESFNIAMRRTTATQWGTTEHKRESRKRAVVSAEIYRRGFVTRYCAERGAWLIADRTI